jgi:hypothetical protein
MHCLSRAVFLSHSLPTHILLSALIAPKVATIGNNLDIFGFPKENIIRDTPSSILPYRYYV